MAPELIAALVEDFRPTITTFSDVYAFASICLEVCAYLHFVEIQINLILQKQIASGQLPYPHRSNDHAVTLDIIRGVKPLRTATCLLKLSSEAEEAFWNMLDQCWSTDPAVRPSMPHLLTFFEVLGMYLP